MKVSVWCPFTLELLVNFCSAFTCPGMLFIVKLCVLISVDWYVFPTGTPSVPFPTPSPMQVTWSHRHLHYGVGRCWKNMPENQAHVHLQNPSLLALIADNLVGIHQGSTRRPGPVQASLNLEKCSAGRSFGVEGFSEPGIPSFRSANHFRFPRWSTRVDTEWCRNQWWFQWFV